MRAHATRLLSRSGTTVRITRTDRASASYDPVTRKLAEPSPVLMYEGPGWLRPTQPGETREAGRLVSTATWSLRVPTDIDVRADDDVEVVACHNEALDGRALRVIATELASARATQRVEVAEAGRAPTRR